MPKDDGRDDETLPRQGERTLTPQARRALAEAQERRLQAADALVKAKEINGRGGAEPVRFGDWEVKGLATDF